MLLMKYDFRKKCTGREFRAFKGHFEPGSHPYCSLSFGRDIYYRYTTSAKRPKSNLIKNIFHDAPPLKT